MVRGAPSGEAPEKRGVGCLWAINEELEGFFVEFTIGVDADVGFFEVGLCADTSAFPHLFQSELLQDVIGGRVVDGDTCCQGDVGVGALDGRGGSIGDL